MIFNITPGSPSVTLSGGYCTLSKTLVREVKWGEDISWGSTCIKGYYSWIQSGSEGYGVF